jgi:hypothetical protein
MSGTAKFRDRIVVTRGEAGGTQDPVTGVWTPADEDVVILACPANVQGAMSPSRAPMGRSRCR